MIAESINIVAKALNDYCTVNYPGRFPGGFVQVNNVARVDGGGGANADEIQSSMLLTMVNIEEEKTLKNQPVYLRRDDRVEKIRPLIHLNLALLFSCADGNYGEALKRLDIVAEFFQQQNVFVPGAGRVERITVEMMSLTFEQQNHLWGILGSKQHPALLYKLRLVIIDKAAPQGAGVIEAIRN
jgi:hypothetical protein